MRLDRPFIQLPITVDASRLRAEVMTLDDGLWRSHPEGAAGNTAIALVATHGDPSDDSVTGPMRPTPILESMPYHRSVMAAFGAPIGRTRLMRIAGEGKLGSHVDTNRYWQEHLRVHVPVVTDPSVRFTCGGEQAHMADGEAWVFDTWRRHGVDNPANHDRVHLVIDTVGSAALWQLIDRGATGYSTRTATRIAETSADPTYESRTSIAVPGPWEQQLLRDQLLADLGPEPSAEHVRVLRDFIADWHALHAQWSGDDAGRLGFAHRARQLDRALDELPAVLLPNGAQLHEAVRQHLIRPALTDEPVLAPGRATGSSSRSRSRLDRPIFIVSPPRSGSTLLFETLARAKDVYTIGGESHEVVEGIPALHPSSHSWVSNALGSEDATPLTVGLLEDRFVARSADRDGRAPAGLRPLRLLEKTPKNALRVPFLAAAFPDAQFVWLHRQPRDSVSSILDAWRSGRFVTYPQLPGWPAPAWSMLLIPGWRDLIASELAEVAGRQWATTTMQLLDDLEQLDPQRWVVASHERLLADPNGEAEQLCRHLGLTWDRPVLGPLPLSKTTLTAPEVGKWRRNAVDLEPVWHLVEPAAQRAAAVLSRPSAPPPPVQPRPAVRPTSSPSENSTSAFDNVHTPTVPELLRRSASSIVLSTYQSGRVIVLRAAADGRLNTHVRALPRPMGIAVQQGGLSIGTDQSVWHFRDRPAHAERLPGPTHDACFVPQSAHVTGDISIHEMAWAGGELWVVNTKFSCLATLSPEYSFVPRWRPAFVTALAPEDRCHLNGMAIVDDRPAFVTAMGMTDERQGWRRDKVGGGVIIDVASEAIVAHGLTMPHSPRWYGGRLWVLDSGRGTLATVDPVTGDVEVVAELPGFTRGLAFIGRYAIVGLSKVREHVFAGLPLSERLSERSCGVWIVDTETGMIVGFTRFEGAVEEVFDVQVMPGVCFPELIEPGDPLAGSCFTLSDEALAEVAG